jgi:hypothetical protein
MNLEDQIQRLRQARELLRPLIEDPAEPQIEAILRSADLELHWALWNLGEVVPHRHDMPNAVPATTP